jgi:hypothetical protein
MALPMVSQASDGDVPPLLSLPLLRMYLTATHHPCVQSPAFISTTMYATCSMM